jgi:hypothetical protein
VQGAVDAAPGVRWSYCSSAHATTPTGAWLVATAFGPMSAHVDHTVTATADGPWVLARGLV